MYETAWVLRDKFKEVAEAYEVLKDAGRRAEYDELRQYGGRAQNGSEPPPGWQSGSGFDSAGSTHFEGDFSDFFTSIFSGGASGHQRRPARGQDAEIELPIFLEETQSDTPKLVEYTIPVYENGQVTQVKKESQRKNTAGCCRWRAHPLEGPGRIRPGRRSPGDLYLHIRLVPHPLFDVEGHNLVITVPLAPWEAALGTKVTVPTLTGKLSDHRAEQSIRATFTC
eukprot:TRINITY_DN9351_c0_g1_i1.p1 TRINITY_DN9351_c0_g1~~TRINITY_DN9351_c0_g1_i1.p1  ORF type:complete len:225 (-),score=-11.94 TRINITY_DN9351_c0_g1_i1:234-908(-)